ncbi:MAG: hypothetical protein CMI54_02220 [Parcubacteria group bacterium]|nr:hypothetical protein [Parcubacteria group bacterium]|tara:strand:+ start:957 stop:1151 length:195 start_codon:yes stop_codon:yes gene_type:complete
MNMPYISLETAFKVINEVTNEYDRMARDGKSSTEKRTGTIGVVTSLKIKKALLKELKKRERDFD